MMDINTLAAKQYEWVERMGWHNKTVLEALALIASEVGEAANECIDGDNTPTFGEELADIFLRIADLSVVTGIDLQDVTFATEVKWRSSSTIEDFVEVMIDMAKWINASRELVLGAQFGTCMGHVMQRVFDIAVNEKINLEEEIVKKMAINEARGTRGRRV